MPDNIERHKEIATKKEKRTLTINLNSLSNLILYFCTLLELIP